MAEAEHTIRGDLMVRDPVTEVLRDFDLQHRGYNPEVLDGCEQIIAKGLALVARHPASEFDKEDRVGSRFLETGSHITLPPVNYEVPGQTNPLVAESLGLLMLTMVVPDDPEGWERIKLRLFAGPHSGKAPKSWGGHKKVIEVSPLYIHRDSLVGTVPGDRIDVNFTLGVIREIGDAVLPKR